MLAITAKMQADGLIHPDGVAKNNQKVWFSQGSAVMTQDTYSSIQSFYRRATDEELRHLAAGARGTATARSARFLLGSPNNSISAIRPSSPERTKALLRVLNWFAAPFGTEEYLFRKFGLPGRHYTLNGHRSGADRGRRQRGVPRASSRSSTSPTAPYPVVLPGSSRGGR